MPEELNTSASQTAEQSIYREELETLAAQWLPYLHADQSPTAPVVQLSLEQEFFPTPQCEDADERQLLPLQSICALPLPGWTKIFLADIGFPPTFMSYTFDFGRKGLIRVDRYFGWLRMIEDRAMQAAANRLGRMPEFDRFFRLPAALEESPSRFYRVGELPLSKFIPMALLCIEVKTGALYQLNIRPNMPEQPLFLNSGVEIFVKFTELYLNGECNPTAVQALRSLLRCIDLRAMADENGGVWPTLLKEMESQL